MNGPSSVPMGYLTPMRVFLVQDGERHWIVAESKASAIETLAIQVCGYASLEAYVQDIGAEPACTPLPWNRLLKINDIDDGSSTELMAYEWAKGHDKPGMIATTAW